MMRLRIWPEMLCVSYLVIVVCAPVNGSESLLQSRIDASPSCSLVLGKLSPAGQSGLKRLIAEGDRLRRMPNLREHHELLKHPEQRLEPSDELYLFFIFGEIQRPSIPKLQLAELLRAQRASVASVRATYSVAHDKDLPSSAHPNPVPRQMRCDFAFDGPKLLFRRSTYVNDGLLKVITESYDGHVCRYVLEEPGKLTNASVNHFDYRRKFIGDGNPLLCAMLFDSAKDLDGRGDTDDLAIAVDLTFVYETPVDVNGVKCVVVGNSTRQYYCSVDAGYALVERRDGELEFDVGTGRFVSSAVYSVLSNSDFENVADEVWLPRRSEHSLLRSGEVVEHFVTTVGQYEVNTDIPVGVFEDVIPKGSFVADGIQNATYRFGIEGSESHGPPEADLGQNNGYGRAIWIVAGNVGVFGVIGIMLFIRRKRSLSAR